MDDSVLGTEVDGYRIEEVLGRGGMGVVYKAEDIALSRTVAIKRIEPSLASDETFLRRFRSEARALARIDSSYIVGVHALRRTEIGLLIVMEYVDGGTLKDRTRKGPMDWQQAMPIITQMLTALEHAHGAEVIHRDVKPHNIMLTQSGTVKVTDFGLAKVHRPDSNETVTQGVYGTLNYMSPEQVQGSADLDHRSDLYSLGMTIYEMLAGELPFDEDSTEFEKMRTIVEESLPRPDQLRPHIPDGLSALVMKALEKDPEDRFQSATVMREAFEAFEAKHGGDGAAGGRATAGSSAETSDSERQWRWRVGAVALVFLLAVGYVLYPDGGSPPPVNDGNGGNGGNVSPSTELSVVTEPTGASVYVGGRLLGVAPLEDAIKGDSAQLRVQKEGYTPVDTTVELAAGAPIELDLRLDPAPTTLSVTTTPTGAVVYGNDTPLGETPINHTFEEGSAQIRVEKEGYAPVDTTIRFGAADQQRLSLALAEVQRYGELRLRAAPSGTVYVDGEAHASGRAIRMPTGTHRIRFQHPEHGTKDTTLTVAADETKELTCYFRHRVVVQSNPVWASVYLNGENTGEDTTYGTELGPGTYRIGARVAEQRGSVTGGTYRLRVGEERRAPQDFSGSDKTIVLEPAFERETHVVDFHVSEEDAYN